VHLAQARNATNVFGEGGRFSHLMAAGRIHVTAFSPGLALPIFTEANLVANREHQNLTARGAEPTEIASAAENIAHAASAMSSAYSGLRHDSEAARADELGAHRANEALAGTLALRSARAYASRDLGFHNHAANVGAHAGRSLENLGRMLREDRASPDELAEVFENAAEGYRFSGNADGVARMAHAAEQARAASAHHSTESQ
jgi:hypothetical protein